MSTRVPASDHFEKLCICLLKNLMSINQQGFMKNRSTITNLLEYASFVLNSKAYNRMRHQLLLNEMSVRIKPARCMWLGSYLSGRIQKIRIGDVVSKDIKVTSVFLGFPQGSRLEPLCYIIVCQQNMRDFRLRPCTLSSCQWIPGLFENSVGSEQTFGVVRQTLIAHQRWLVNVRLQHLPDQVILWSSHTCWVGPWSIG
jgi:Reverse transcriptase (RNA-dependent DNA polymerase)